MAGERCSNCGGVILTSRSKCLTCGHQDKISIQERTLGLRSWFKTEPEPSLATVNMVSLMGTSPAGAMGTVSPGKSSDRNTHNEKPHRGKGRKALIVIGVLLCAVLLLGGYYAIRVNRIFNTINSVSAPEGNLTGDALGGSSDITIDTGPALTAMAGGSQAFAPVSATEPPSENSSALIADPPRASMRSGSDATAEPSVTVPATATVTTASVVTVPQGSVDSATETTFDIAESTVASSDSTSTPSPEPTATATSTSAPVEPDVSPTIVLSQIERAKNGDFELGNDGSWHLEQGAAIDTRGGIESPGVLTISEIGGYADQRLFFVPETEYRLTASVKLASAPADGETIQIGIAFTDESGTRLSSSEPAPIAVTSTGWTDVSFDYAPPAEATDVMVFLWKSSGATLLLVDNVSVRSIVPEEALVSGEIASDPNSMTILLMGVDARPGEAIDIGVRPDSLMVLHLNADSSSCRVLSIPRDTRTELPGYGLSKINHALAVGGIEYEVQVVEQLIGLEIDHYVLIDFNGFEDLVDAMGGITVNVPEAFVSDDGRAFPAGEQTMSGVEALSYARWRGGADGDFGRMERQQLILRALVQKASGLNVVRSINELLPAVEENLRTDLSPTQMASIATDYRTGCTESNINMIRLEGSPATYNDPLLQLPLYYIEIEPGEIRQKVATLIEP